jgi:hypothetical protein
MPGFLMQVEADWVMRIIKCEKADHDHQTTGRGELLPVVVWRRMEHHPRSGHITIGTTTPTGREE